MYTYLWVLFQCYVLFQQLGWRSACRRWSKVGLAVLQRSVPHHRKYGSGMRRKSDPWDANGISWGCIYDIYIYITYICMYIYICRELGFTDISDHLDAWNGLKRSETALRSVLTGNRSRNSRKMNESNAKTHPNSLDILLTLKAPEKNGRNFHWQNKPSPISSSAYRQVRKLIQGDAKRWGFWTSGGGGVQHMWLGHQGSNNKLKQVTPHKYNPPIQKKKIVDLKPAIIGIFTNKHGNMSNKKWI